MRQLFIFVIAIFIMPKSTQYKKNSVALKSWVEFAKRKSRTGQWNAVKNWARTGKSDKGLTFNTVQNFTRLGLNVAELKNAGRKNPYRATLVRKQEIERQIEDLIDLLHPKIGKDHKIRNAKAILRKFRLVGRGDVELAIEDKDVEDVFDTGRMYLSSLNPRNESQARKKGLNRGDVGYHNGDLVLRGDWHKTKYVFTTPLHESAHELIGEDERKVFLADFYYSLKRGIMSESYLRRKKLHRPEEIEVRPRAIELFRLGRRNGWKKADAELRKAVSA